MQECSITPYLLTIFISSCTVYLQKKFAVESFHFIPSFPGLSLPLLAYRRKERKLLLFSPASYKLKV